MILSVILRSSFFKARLARSTNVVEACFDVAKALMLLRRVSLLIKKASISCYWSFISPKIYLLSEISWLNSASFILPGFITSTWTSVKSVFWCWRFCWWKSIFSSSHSLMRSSRISNGGAAGGSW